MKRFAIALAVSLVATAASAEPGRRVILGKSIAVCRDTAANDALSATVARQDYVESMKTLGSLVSSGKCTIAEAGEVVTVLDESRLPWLLIRKEDGHLWVTTQPSLDGAK